MSSVEIEKWLVAHTGNEQFDPHLSRVNQAINVLSLLPTSKIVTITGTNGKGSVTRLLSKCLAQKYSVAHFTSPHLYSIAERFCLNQQTIKEDELFHNLKNIYQILINKKIKLTFFELLFITFLYWLKESLWPDYIVLEVGLGGRLDATNALDAELAIITSISRDHQEFLGHRYDAILQEKIGIIRKNKTLLTAFDLNYLIQGAQRRCQQHMTRYVNLEKHCDFNSLNQAIVQKALDILEVDTNLARSLEDVIGLSGLPFEFYGSHNPGGVRKLVQFLKQEHYNKRKDKFDLLVLSFSQRSEKDLTVMLKTFKLLVPDQVNKIIVTSFDHNKAEKKEILKILAKENGIEFVESIIPYISQNKKIIVSGSNYFFRDFYNIYFTSCPQSEPPITVR